MVKFLITVFFLFFIIHMEVLPRVFALMYEYPNATVVLSFCSQAGEEMCTFNGTLRTSPVTLGHVLVQSDGSELYFTRDQVLMLSYPVTK